MKERKMTKRELISSLVKREAVELAAGERPKIGACLQCGKPFTIKKTGKPRQFCHQPAPCRDRYQRAELAREIELRQITLEPRWPNLVGPPSTKLWLAAIKPFVAEAMAKRVASKNDKMQDRSE